MSSSYYYNLYKEEKEKARKYEKWIKELQRIRENASGGLEDEIRNVNKEINELCADLKDAVKHDQVFALEAYEVGSSTEAGTGSDQCLRATNSSIDDEIRRLSQKKSDAERKRDEYYRKYEDEKQRERREREEEERRRREEAMKKK